MALLLTGIVLALAFGRLAFAQIIVVVFLDGSCFVFFQLALLVFAGIMVSVTATASPTVRNAPRVEDLHLTE